MKKLIIPIFLSAMLAACGDGLTSEQRLILKKSEAPAKIAKYTYVRDPRTDLCFAVSNTEYVGQNAAIYSATNVPCTEQVLKQIQQ